jgi:hypothetical protein
MKTLRLFSLAVLIHLLCVGVLSAGGRGLTPILAMWNFIPAVALGDTFSTLTQQKWGDSSAVYVGTGYGPLDSTATKDLLPTLISTRLIVGDSSLGRSLKFNPEAARCVNKRLPGSGAAAALPTVLGWDSLTAWDGCNSTSPMPVSLTKDGRFRNSLLGETIALTLNIRLSTASGYDLAGYSIPKILCTNNIAGTDQKTFRFANFWAGKTVGDILSTANTALAGQPAGLGNSGIKSAASNINQAFDGARYVVTSCTQVTFAGDADDQEFEEASGSGAEFVPKDYALFQSYPNPFNPTTIIRFDVPTPSIVTLKIYNVLGQEVAVLLDGEMREEGRHEVRVDGSRLSSGMYFYRLVASSSTSTKSFVSLKKMLLLK